MKCEACLEMMDELIEGELDSSLVREATAHMAMCGPCSQFYANLRYEQELYRQYLLDVEPTPAVWANLRLGLEKEKAINTSQSQLRLQRRTIALGGLHVTPPLATALVLIVIGLAIGIMVWRTTTDASRHQAQVPGVSGQPSPEVNRAGTDRDSANTDRRGSANDNDGKILPSSPKNGDRGREVQVSAAGRADRHRIERSPVVQTVDQVVRRAEQQYLSAIEILSRDIKRHRAVISPALLSQVETALAEIDRNIAATRRVAREQPRDPVAVEYLALAYEKKIELLREVTIR
jgi:hypothetical protein